MDDQSLVPYSDSTALAPVSPPASEQVQDYARPVTGDMLGYYSGRAATPYSLPSRYRSSPPTLLPNGKTNPAWLDHIAAQIDAGNASPSQTMDLVNSYGPLPAVRENLEAMSDLLAGGTEGL